MGSRPQADLEAYPAFVQTLDICAVEPRRPMLHRRNVMAGRPPLACLAIVTALAAVACFAPVASAGIFCVESTFSCGPDMSLQKSGPQYVNQGDTAEYTYDLYNTGTADISDVTVADNLCSPLSGPDGDDGDGILDVDEHWTYTCSYAPAGDPGDEVVNHATADGTAFGEDPVHADASHSTWITALHVAKSVDLATADPFDELHYTITITNDGPDNFDYYGYLYDQNC